MTHADDLAFPHNDSDAPAYRCGLTKLEYFAAMAMQGLLTKGLKAQETYDDIIVDAYNCAQMLINELNKQ